jgi:ribonuclease P protein component
VDRSPPDSGERLTREERLRRRADFLRCYRRGRRRHSALAVLHFVPNRAGHPRLGITASRKVGNSVVRHRLKRRVREIFRRWGERRNLPPIDIVVHLKPESSRATFEHLSAELQRMLRELLSGRAS